MEAAHLLDRGHTAIPAEIVNLTVQKAARLVEDAERPLDDRYKLVLVDAAAAEDRDDDSAIRSLFLSTTPGTAVELDRHDRKLGDRVAALTAQARNNVRTRGFLVRKKSRLAGWLRFLAFAIGAAAVCDRLLGRRQPRRQRPADAPDHGAHRVLGPVLRVLRCARAALEEGLGGARAPAGHPAVPHGRGGGPHPDAAEPDRRRAHPGRSRTTPRRSSSCTRSCCRSRSSGASRISGRRCSASATRPRRPPTTASRAASRSPTCRASAAGTPRRRSRPLPR